jgi:hypothetical protein
MGETLSRPLWPFKIGSYRAMSLIRVRRDRKKDWIDARKGLKTRALVFLLILAGAAIWYLTTAY